MELYENSMLCAETLNHYAKVVNSQCYMCTIYNEHILEEITIRQFFKIQ